MTVVAEKEEYTTEPQEGCLRQLSPWINLLLGWVHAKALYFSTNVGLLELVIPHIERTDQVWTLLLFLATYPGAWYLTEVCIAVSKTKGVAFWVVVTYFLHEVVYCVWLLSKAARKGTIK